MSVCNTLRDENAENSVKWRCKKNNCELNKGMRIDWQEKKAPGVNSELLN